MNLRHINVVLFLLLAITTSVAFADPFGELDSYDRQQSASDGAFDDFESEFETPSQSRQVQSKPEVVEKIVTRIVVVEKEVAPTPPVQEVAAPAPRVKSRERTVFKNGLLFSLKGCSKRHGEVSCLLTVLSEDSDLEVSIFSTNQYRADQSTSFFDNAGNQYYANNGMFGNKNTGAHRHGGGAKNRIIRGIPTKIKLNFQNISETTQSISLLELKAQHKQMFDITFRDVPFT